MATYRINAEYLPKPHRKTDDIQDVDAIIEANRVLISESWKREFSNPDSYWHKRAVNGKGGA
jgi:hypothetical protein